MAIWKVKHESSAELRLVEPVGPDHWGALIGFGIFAAVFLPGVTDPVAHVIGWGFVAAAIAAVLFNEHVEVVLDRGRNVVSLERRALVRRFAETHRLTDLEEAGVQVQPDKVDGDSYRLILRFRAPIESKWSRGARSRHPSYRLAPEEIAVTGYGSSGEHEAAEAINTWLAAHSGARSD